MNAHRFLQLTYWLLWPPALVAITRRSLSPDLFGYWSYRAFAIAACAAGVLAAATLLLWKLRPDEDGRIVLDRAIVALRRVAWARWLVGWLPLCAWLALVFYMAVIDVPLTLPVTICLVDLLCGTLCVAAAVALVGRPRREVRLALMKCGAAAGGALITVAAIEVAAAVMGWSSHGEWDVNPPNLNVRFQTADFDTTVITNAQGLREPELISPRAATGARRIVIIGDSMTFGWGVAAAESYPQVTAQLLRAQRDVQLAPVEIVNMGRPGANPNDYLRFLNRAVADLSPDIVVIGFLVGNDCPVSAPADLHSDEDVQREFARYLDEATAGRSENIALQSFLARLVYTRLLPAMRRAANGRDEGRRGAIFGEANPLGPALLQRDLAAADSNAREQHQRLLRSGWVDKGLEWRINPWLVHSAMLHADGPAESLATGPADRTAIEHEWRLCAKLFREMKRVAEESDAELIVLAIPHAHAVSNRWVTFLGQLGCQINDQMTSSTVINDWIREMGSQQNLVVVDPLSQFRELDAAGDDLYFQTDDHMTPRGHQLLAKTLAPVLAEYLKTAPAGDTP